MWRHKNHTLENKFGAIRPPKNLNLKAKPITDTSSDKFNLKEFLALKKREREGRNNLVEPATNENKMLPSPITIVNGEKEDSLRQKEKVLRTFAATKQPNNTGKDKNVREDVVGPWKR